MTEHPAGTRANPGREAALRGLGVLAILALLLLIWQFLPTSEDDADSTPNVIETGVGLPLDHPGDQPLPEPIHLSEGEGWEPERAGGRPPLVPPDDVDYRVSDVDRLPDRGVEGGEAEEAYGLGAPPPTILLPRGVRWYPGRAQRDETGGRVKVPASAAWIGTPQRWVDGITAARRGEVPEAFDFEAPRHRRDVTAFEMDLYEVTNAQYLWFLRLASAIDVRVDRRNGIEGTLEEIARALVFEDIPDNLDWEHVTRQLYEANREALHARQPGLVVVDPTTDVVQPEATFQSFRTNPIRIGTLLSFYTRAPPGHWPTDAYELGDEEDPVRFISFEEAQAFAHWAGKHVPTEFEWEYAARGEKGLAYPWGGRSIGFEERVNGGLPRTRGDLPATVPFNSMPAGASWLGCFHMLGNVAEWTSSFLVPYPGSDATHPDQGKALVVRGGSAADQDSLRVRPAFRGWRAPYTDAGTGGVMEFTPYPRRRLPWVGFRCAVYPEHARSRLPEMQYHLVVNELLPAPALAIDRYSGAEAKELLPPGTSIEAGIFVPKQAFAMTCAAFERIALPTGASPAFTIEGPHTIRSNAELFAETDGAAPMLFGMIQTDFPITRVLTVKGGSPGTVPDRLFDARAPAGHYIVALIHDHLALLDPDFSTVYYLSPGTATSANVNVLKQKPPADGTSPVAAVQHVDVSGGGVHVEFRVPLGGGANDGHVVLVRFQYTTPRGAMGAVGLAWQEHTAR